MKRHLFARSRRAFVVVAMVITTMLATALPALAHHPEVAGQATCLANGDVQVDWDAVAWAGPSTNSRTHPTIEVAYREDGGTWQDLAVGAYNAGNGFSFGSGDASYDPLIYAYGDPAPTTVQFRVHAVPTGQQAFNGQPGGTWANGASGGDSRTSLEITLPTDCEPPTQEVPPTPHGDLTSSCAAWAAAVSVDALGEHEVAVPDALTFQVVEGSTVLGSVELEPGESDTLSGTFPEDSGDHDIRLVVVGGDELDTATVGTDCEPNPVEPVPAGDLTTRCGSWEAAVSVDPLGQHEYPEPDALTFQVVEGSTVLGSVELEPGESDTLSGTFPEDSGDHDIRLVVVGGDELDTATVGTDCEAAPDAWIGDVCAVGGIEVLLVNPDEPTAEFAVYSGETLIETVQLSEATTPYVVLVPASEGETVDITVMVTGQQTPLFTAEITRDCEPPVVVTEVCSPDGDLVVTVNEQPADTFHLTIDGGNLAEPIHRSTTEPATEWVEAFDLEDGTYTVTVRDGTERVIDEQVVVVDCDAPVVVVAQSCVDGAGTVVVTVEEAPEDSFTATIGATTVDVVDGVATFEGLDDGTYTVTVRDSDEVVVHTEDVTVDCDAPVVEVVEACVADDGSVTVTVDEAPEDEFTVTIGDTSVDVVDGQAVIDGLADGTYTVVVTDGDGTVVHRQDVTVDCDDDTGVGGEEIERPAPAPTPAPKPAPVVDTTEQLPVTGAAAQFLLMLGLLGLALGGVMLRLTAPASMGRGASSTATARVANVVRRGRRGRRGTHRRWRD